MSKRPKTEASARSRLRSPVGQLRDLPIWSKLVLIMIVPTLATVVVGLTGLVERIDASNTADQARTLAAVTNDAGNLVHHLQDERATATIFLGSPETEVRSTYEDTFAATDGAAKTYRERRAGLGNIPDSFRDLLKRIDERLGKLPVLRQSVGGADATLTGTIFQYDTLISDLISIRDFASQLAGDSVLSYEMRAAAAIASAKESLSQERITVERALARKEMPPSLRQSFTTSLVGQQESLQAFNVVATSRQRALLEQTVSGSDLRDSVRFEGLITGMTADKLPNDVPTTEVWDSAMSGRADLMRIVEQSIDNQTVADATRIRDDVTRQVIIEAILLFGLLLLGIVFALLVARSMNRSLRELRHGALTVAQYGLPQAVARLRDPALATQMSPAQVAAQIAEPLPVRSKDEFGQVAEAFNAVHLEAVRTAAEQAALRSSVAQMFVNLARRSQILVDRLIGHLDRLERGEEDPDRLAELFQLDHLATRMRRNDENLLVLAGADSTRVQREPAPLIDVLRAAQSEVEHYTRIEFGVVDRDLEIAAHAVNDLVHLVAELFDNATAFSPPDSVVVVEARRVGDRAVLYVEDHGIGISADQLADLNERLANPPMVDVAVSRMMGLVVVARLANRHGVTVELRPASDRGTVADVLLPSAVLVPRAVAGRGPGMLPPAEATPAPRTPTGGRPQLGAPLALESGSPAGAGRPNSGAMAGGLLAGAAFARGGPASTPAAPGGNRPPTPPTSPAPPRMPEPPAAPRTPPAQTPPPAPARPAAPPSGAPRNLPAWSDLTGAESMGTNGGGAFPAAPAFGEPLPHRRGPEPQRPAETPAADGNGARPVIPRQVPKAPERPEPASEVTSAGMPKPIWPSSEHPGAPARPTAGRPDATSDIRPTSGSPLVPGMASAPPAPSRPAPAPAQPEQRPGFASGPPARPADRAPAPAPTRPAGATGDETVEMPIFRELESAWFQARPQPTRQSRPEAPTRPDRPAAPPRPTAPPPAAARPAAPEAGRPPASTTAGTTPMAGSPRPAPTPGSTDHVWRTAADDGWRAASAVGQSQDGGETGVGLPRRVPMAQLVPGGVEPAAATATTATATHRRTPDAVRGLLSAYHRGVQRGRTNNPTADESTTNGPNGPQSGKEQEA